MNPYIKFQNLAQIFYILYIQIILSTFNFLSQKLEESFISVKSKFNWEYKSLSLEETFNKFFNKVKVFSNFSILFLTASFFFYFFFNFIFLPINPSKLVPHFKLSYISAKLSIFSSAFSFPLFLGIFYVFVSFPSGSFPDFFLLKRIFINLIVFEIFRIYVASSFL